MEGRPVVAAVFASMGAVATLAWSIVAAIGVSGPLTAPTLFAFVMGIGSAVAVFPCAIALVLRPRHAVALGSLIALFSMMSLFGYFGGLCFGPAIGVLGGLMAVSRSSPGTPPVGDSGPLIACTFGAFLIELGAVFGTFGPYPFPKSPPEAVLLGVGSGISIFAGGLLQYLRPADAWAPALAVLLSSAASFYGAYAGFAGGAIGFVAGLITIIRWGENRWIRSR